MAALAELTPLGVERQAAGAERLEQEQAAFVRSLSEPDRLALERVLAAIK